MDDLEQKLAALFEKAIKYGIEVETDYYGAGKPEAYIKEPAAEWAKEAVALIASSPSTASSSPPRPATRSTAPTS